MISVKRFVTERAVDFITILEEDFPRQCFTSSFPRFSMTSLIGYRIEQIQGNVFTYTTKHKEAMKHKRFRQKIVFVRCKKIDR